MLNDLMKSPASLKHKTGQTGTARSYGLVFDWVGWKWCIRAPLCGFSATRFLASKQEESHVFAGPRWRPVFAEFGESSWQVKDIRVS